MRLKRNIMAVLVFSAAMFGVGGSASAEVDKITVAWQYGINYLPLMVMQKEKLVEKRAKEAGVDNLHVEWFRLGTASAVNDALLSGQITFAAVGVPSLVTLWAKTISTYKVRSIGAVCSMPIYLVANGSHIKTIKDFRPTDRIALPGVKVSIQAVILEMAAANAFGEKQYAKLDPLTVGMSQPDGMVALLSGRSNVTAQFGGPPYQYEELKHAGMHRVLSSYDVLGGSHTYTQIYATGKFYEDNPKISKAFFEALRDADHLIASDKRGAIRIYREVSGDRKTSDQVLNEILSDPDVKFTVTPQKSMEFAKFMHSVGSVSVVPKTWKDLFFPIVHKLPGS